MVSVVVAVVGTLCIVQSTDYVASGRFAIKSQILNLPFKCRWTSSSLTFISFKSIFFSSSTFFFFETWAPVAQGDLSVAKQSEDATPDFTSCVLAYRHVHTSSYGTQGFMHMRPTEPQLQLLNLFSYLAARKRLLTNVCPLSPPNPHGSHLSLNKSPGSQSPQGSTFFDLPDFGHSHSPSLLT